VKALNRILLLLFLLVSFLGCSGDDEPDPLTFEEQLAIDVEIIDEYLEENNITAQTDDSGLRYVISEQGTGSTATLNDNVVVSYEGRLLSDGSVFDQAPESDPLNFPLNRLIQGWQIGLRKIQEGGSITLYIPSGLGYGPGGTSGIPANANLIFDISLLEVQ